MPLFLEIAEALLIIIACELAIFRCASRISYQYNIPGIYTRNWAVLSTLMICIFVIVYIFWGGGIDTKCWVDTTGYYSAASRIADNSISITEYIGNQEWPPHVGYEIFCGVIFKVFGNNVFLLCLFNAYVCVLSSYLLFRIGLHMTTPTISIRIASLFILCPLLVHFSFYLLKDISVLFFVTLVVFSFLEAQQTKKIKYWVIVGIALFCLLFIRSFYVLFLILWVAVCLFNKKDRAWTQRVIFAAVAIAVSAGLITVLGSLNYNIGYTLGGKDSFLTFIPQIRVSMNWPSISAFILIILNHLTEFLKSSVIELLRVFVGPFYWTHFGNFIYLTDNGRFILFENLTSLYLILLLVRRITKPWKRNNSYSSKCIRWLIYVFLVSLLLVGDIRWKLSLMPFYILLLGVGIYSVDRNGIIPTIEKGGPNRI